MKKNDPEKIDLFKRRQFRRKKNQIFLKGQLRRKRRQKNLLPSFAVVRAPEVFALDSIDCRSDFLDFAARLRTLCFRGVSRIKIDLANVKRLYPACTLLFAAEVFRLIEASAGKTMFRCIPPKASKPRKVLKQLGILDRLCCHIPDVPKGQDVVHWKLASGNDVRGEKFEETVGHYDGKIAEALSGGLYNGMVEAMKNSKQHAYIEDRADGLAIVPDGGPWWMLSQQREGNLFVAFCDLGIGIPGSLPKKWPEMVSGLLRSSDSSMIEAASRLGRSRTNLSYRGRGLSHICEDVMLQGGGRVLILSNKGRYEISRGRDGAIVHKAADFKDSILGTIIIWKVALKAEGYGTNNI